MSQHAGHRTRLINKLRHTTLCEHEWLELLLFNAVPRRNTNGMAHNLLLRFGSVQAVIQASIEELEAVEGIGTSVAAYLHAFGLLCVAYGEKIDTPQNYPEMYEDESFRAYLQKRFIDKEEELIDVYCVDNAGKVYSCKTFTVGKRNTVGLKIEEFAKILETEKPSGILLAHNHPDGSLNPSAQDDETTARCQTLCETHDVLLCEHYVCTPGGIYSYVENGKIEKGELGK